MNFIHLMLLACCTVAQKTTQSTKTKSDKNINTTVTSVASLVTISTPSLESQTVDVNDTIEATSYATCEANSSCLEEPNSNDTLTGTNTSTTRNNPKDQYERTDIYFSSNEMCTCDLQVNICDINCCCDKDCSREDRLVFHHCEFENVYYDTRYCDYIKYIYVNNTPFQWHVNQNGLFCVLKSNLPPSFTIQRRQPILSFEAAQHEKQDKFSWSSATKKEVKFHMTEEFVYGNHIWTIQKNEIKNFYVPKKLFSSSCLAREDVLNLKNVNNICAQTDITEENRHLHFKTYFQNVTFVSNPIFFNTSKFKGIQGCPKNICLAVLTKICDRDFNNCQNISKNDSRVEVKCSFHTRLNKNDCKNVVKALQYNFYHNGTQGFTKIEILGVLEQLSFEFGTEDFEYFQEFKVNFWWINQTRNFSSMRSGNPGYLIGKPILSGRMVIVGNSTNATTKIERFSNDYLKNFLVLPKNVKGNCILSNTDYLTIEFGYNLQTKCKHYATVVNKKRYHNATKICRELQNTILKVWGFTYGNRTVGMFGNANANEPKDWTKIMYNLSIEKLLNRTSGRFNSQNTTLSCFGLANELVVDVYHSRIDFANLRDQEKILGVTYSFEGFVNKSMPYNMKANTTHMELKLESSVAFYDISVVKQQKFVDRPSLEIRLPYDFFYPFIKIDNGSESWSTCNYFHVFLCLVVLFIE